MATILIVDDSPSQVAHFVKILEAHGFDHLVAEDGASGVALAKSAKPDVILMDVVMPELNGFQATRKLTQDPETKDIPVIMVTTKDQETDRVWGKRQGAKGFMVKPVDEAELLAEINSWL
ncbi:response regulator [Reinekea marinisedimentorum]|uniref:Twitching motility two-component system response regulator PilH n=1 Tax=Reinekea marinisedimentorum TaxID=230495 RepID=A0A4R3I8P3_9GAMM|nr:response regulator [Reinekea marinisedimentorum]TCS41669.1 twitching motility two-component system response regulator PilH [Reinekea marinisedimentorum]